MSSQVGRAISLRIPQPYLIILDTQYIPERFGSIYRDTGPMYAFASRQASDNPVSFEALLNLNSPTADKIIAAWDQFNHAIAFDEWIDKDDRNNGTLSMVQAKVSI